MKKCIVLFLFLGILFSCSHPPSQVAGIFQDYIERWKSFYPSLSFSAGDLESAFAFEDFSLKKIDTWIDHSHEVLDRLKHLPDDISLDERIDFDLLERQVLCPHPG